ncbi:MAG: hypothetical protein AAFX87_02795 [Bacteroidota bacterium]
MGFPSIPSGAQQALSVKEFAANAAKIAAITAGVGATVLAATTPLAAGLLTVSGAMSTAGGTAGFFSERIKLAHRVATSSNAYLNLGDQLNILKEDFKGAGISLLERFVQPIVKARKPIGNAFQSIKNYWQQYRLELQYSKEREQESAARWARVEQSFNQRLNNIKGKLRGMKLFPGIEKDAAKLELLEKLKAQRQAGKQKGDDVSALSRDIVNLKRQLRADYFKQVFDKFKSGAQKAKSAIQDLGGKVKKVFWSGNSNQFNSSVKTTTKSIYQLEKHLEQLNLKRKHAFSTEQIKRFNSQIASTEKSISRLKGLGSATSGPSRGQRFKAGLKSKAKSDLGNDLVGKGFGLIKSSVTEAAKFEDKLIQIRNTTAITDNELKQVEKTLQGIKTRTSYIDLLEMYNQSKAIPKHLRADFVEVADKVKVVMGESLNLDTNAFAIRMQSIYKNAEKLGKTGGKNIVQYAEDIMSKVHQLGSQGANVKDVFQGLQDIQQMKGANIDPKQYLELQAILSHAGIKASTTNTALQKIVKVMNTNPVHLAKAVGMGVKEFQELLKINPIEALRKIKESTKGDAGKLYDFGLKGKGSTEAINLLLALPNKDEHERHLSEIAKKTKNLRSLTDAYKASNESMGGSMDQAKKAGIRLMVTLGNQLKPVIMWLSTKMNQAAQFIKNNWSAIQPILIGIGVALGILAIKMIAVNIAMWANPLGLVLLGVMTLVAGIVYLYQKVDTFKQQMNGLWQDMKAFGSEVAQIFGEMWQTISNAFGFGGKSASDFGTTFKIVGMIIRGAVNVLMNNIKFGLRMVGWGLKGLLLPVTILRNLFLGIKAWIDGGWDGAVKYFKNIGNAILDFFLAPLKSAWKYIKGMGRLVGIGGKATEVEQKVPKKQREDINNKKDNAATLPASWGGVPTLPIDIPKGKGGYDMPEFFNGGKGMLGFGGIQSGINQMNTSASNGRVIEYNMENLVGEINITANNINDIEDGIEEKVVAVLNKTLNNTKQNNQHFT